MPKGSGPSRRDLPTRSDCWTGCAVCVCGFRIQRGLRLHPAMTLRDPLLSCKALPRAQTASRLCDVGKGKRRQALGPPERERLELLAGQGEDF